MSHIIQLDISVGLCLFVMITSKMEQKIGELKKNIDQPFEAQSEMIKSVVDDVCVVLVVIFKEEIKNKNKG